MGLPSQFTELGPGVTINGALLDSNGARFPNVRGGLPSGRVLYVCSNGGRDGFGDGTNINMPLASLGGATGALARIAGRTNKGDVIYVLPGHSENVSAADYFSDTGSASGFSVIGLGSGALRPTFNWTAATSTWLLDTTGVEIANCILNLCGSTATGTLTVATPITVSAADCRIVNCYINWGQDTDTGCGSTLGAIAVTAARFEFVNNFCPNLDTAGTLAVSFLSLNGADDAVISSNTIYGGTTSTTVGPVHCVTTASKRIRIIGNVVENLKASSTKAVTSAIASVTGTIAGNYCRVQSGIVAFTIASTPFLCSFYNNYTADTDTQNGALDIANGTST